MGRLNDEIMHKENSSPAPIPAPLIALGKPRIKKGAANPPASLVRGNSR
jgi:hypothetical protein